MSMICDFFSYDVNVGTTYNISAYKYGWYSFKNIELQFASIWYPPHASCNWSTLKQLILRLFWWCEIVIDLNGLANVEKDCSRNSMINLDLEMLIVREFSILVIHVSRNEKFSISPPLNDFFFLLPTKLL